ncbi:hypothetical protein [uncultured Corynebacterium sp.]|uniref:hypothetical protein n=1 Tax=uncultured Corynebacterium sp. TaxID=159447 RepID=UPI0025F71FE1|nr:hypothetical protein [uncultured Corynebacterium sp.]
MTIPRDRTTLRRRLLSLFQDWRWDGTWSLRTIPTDGCAPLFGDDDAQCQRHRRVITDMITEGFPGADVHCVNLESSTAEPSAPDDPATPARLITMMCHDLAIKDERPLTQIFVYQLGVWRGFAIHHMWGDGPTMRDRLGSVYAYMGSIWPCGRFADDLHGQLENGTHTVAPRKLTRSDATFVMQFGAWVETLIKRPWATVRSVKDVLSAETTSSEHHGDDRQAVNRQPIETVPAELLTTTLAYTWEGQEREKPRAIPLAWDWWNELNSQLDEGDGYLDPNEFWLIVGLRRNSTILAHRGGNLLVRSRMTVGGSRDTDIAATKQRLKSPFAVTRAALSAAPQLVKQILQLPRTVSLPTMATGSATSPSSITTMWTYNRLAVDEPQEIAVGTQGLGTLLVGSFEEGRTYRVIISGFVSQKVHRAGVEALDRVVKDAGYTRL